MDITLISKQLDAVGYLDEAILDRLSVSRFQTRVSIDFDVTWSVQPRGQELTIAHFVFDGVRELRIQSDLFPEAWRSRSTWNWSLNEIATARVDEPDLPNLGADLHWISFIWQSDPRRIDVAFEDLVVSTRRADEPRSMAKRIEP